MPAVRNLDHEIDVASRKRRRARRSVQSLGTSAKALPCLGNPEWMADLEYVWRKRTHDALQRLHQRARGQRRKAMQRRPLQLRGRSEPELSAGERVTLLRSSEWAEHRAQAMALPRGELLAACGTRTRVVRCDCGPREIKVGCDQVQLCARCRQRHWRRWRRRITRALDAHVRAARAEWHTHRGAGGKLPGVYLITLTVPHSGSIAVDRERLAKGWRKLTKIASARHWWGAYALTYEVTPGQDGLGHVHVHIAAVSSWIPYEELHGAWRSITGARVLDVSAPGSRRRESAADYLAKYVTKGVDPAVFTGQKAGELLCAFRGKRKVTTSLEFWSPLRDRETLCQTCGARHRSMGAPQSLRSVAPGAVLQAMAERIGWWVPRGGVQVVLQI